MDNYSEFLELLESFELASQNWYEACNGLCQSEDGVKELIALNKYTNAHSALCNFVNRNLKDE